MPFYEYLCQGCDHSLEALQKVGEAPLTDCPSCHEPKLNKQLSAPGFRLSGSGWYETDFKTGAKKNLKDSSDGSASKDSGASNNKSDSSSGSNNSSSNNGSSNNGSASD